MRCKPSPRRAGSRRAIYARALRLDDGARDAKTQADKEEEKHATATAEKDD